MIVRRIEFPSDDPNFPQFVAVLKDVYVSRRGLIFDRHCNMIPEVNFNVEFWPRYCPADGLQNLQHISRNEVDSGPVEVLPDDTLYVYGLHYFGFYVFGHLWDTLQPLLKIEDCSLTDGTLLVNGFTSHVNEIGRHFELVGYGATRRKTIKALTYVPELWYPSQTCYPGRLTRQGRDWLRSKYIDANLAAAGAMGREAIAGLYLSRNDDHGRMKRRVLNHEHVVDLLVEQGFRVLDGSESLNEHIRLFRAARHVVGPHGSMLRNVLFAGSKCSVLEFCPDNRLDHSIFEVGRVCDLDYQFVQSPADRNHNIWIDLATLAAWLDGPSD